MAKASFGQRLKALFGIGRKENDEFFDDLADLLIEGDLGAKAAFEAVEALKASVRSKALAGHDAILQELRSILGAYGKEGRLSLPERGLSLILVLGVNGVGKTTQAAKLARRIANTRPGSPIILAAADTFRAAAIDQLKLHGERLKIRVVAQEHGSDPGAVIHDAISAAEGMAASAGSAVVIADTAGRMHTKSHLVRELEKIHKIVRERVSPEGYKKILVLDATTGQNGLHQAEVFHEAVDVSGVILAKYDSSARGGLALAVGGQLGLPILYLGKGEGLDDLEEFSLESYLDDFLSPRARDT